MKTSELLNRMVLEDNYLNVNSSKLASYRYAAVALYYCKGKGLSKKLSEIPLEIVEQAIDSKYKDV